MQTVTFVLDGALEHRDHTGGHGVLRQGDVQWMTAGHGVMHSELPHERETAQVLLTHGDTFDDGADQCPDAAETFDGVDDARQF